VKLPYVLAGDVPGRGVEAAGGDAEDRGGAVSPVPQPEADSAANTKSTVVRGARQHNIS
jgi:hypothetical protein